MKIIFECFGHLEGYISNFEKKYDNRNYSMYIENAITSLISYKKANTNCYCKYIFVTNVKIEDKYKKIFEKNDIEILNCHFDDFVFEPTLRYSLAYYKLRCFDEIINIYPNNEYLMVDSDTFCHNNLNDLFEEANKHLLLMVMDYKLSYEKSKINQTYKELYHIEDYLPYYGSEAICCNYEIGKKMMTKCHEVYDLMIEKNIRTDVGDEFIWIAAIYNDLSLRLVQKDIRAYVKRIFTAFNFNNQANCQQLDDIWHLPAEKKVGFNYIYKKYILKGKFPSVKKSSKILGIVKIRKTVGINYMLHIWNIFRTKVLEK